MLSILWHVSANSTRLDGLLENTVTELMICIPHPLRNHLDFTLTSTRYFLHALILHPMVLIFIQTIKEEPLNRIFWQVKKESRPLPLYETCSSNVFKTNNIITTSMILPVKWAQTRAIFFFNSCGRQIYKGFHSQPLSQRQVSGCGAEPGQPNNMLVEELVKRSTQPTFPPCSYRSQLCNCCTVSVKLVQV